MSVDKYPSTFLRQMEAIVYILLTLIFQLVNALLRLLIPSDVLDVQYVGI